MKHFKNKSIKSVLILTITLLTSIAILFTGVFFFTKYSKSSEENAILSTQQIIQQVNMNLGSYLSDIIKVADIVNDEINKSENIQNKDIQNIMNIVMRSRDDIVSISVFSEDGELMLSEPSSNKLKLDAKIKYEGWFEKPLFYPYINHFSVPHSEELFENNNKWVVSLSRGLYIKKNNKITRAVLLVNVNFKNIDKMCRNVSLGKNGYIYIIDRNGTYIYSPAQESINETARIEQNKNINEISNGSLIEDSDNGKRIITINPVNYTEWKTVGFSDMDEVISAKKNFQNYIIMITIVGIILFFILSTLVSSKISKPIIELKKSMKMVEAGNFDINVKIKGESEVEELSESFNIMVLKIRQLMNQIVVEQEAKRKSELDALQSQINPHFLYNTLDSIVWMAENGNSQDVITMVTSLAKLFRISISRGKNIISVAQEIEHAKNYLIIQKIRYKNKFEFDIKADEEVLKCRTLKLILQPIIENSIYHGIEYMVDEGRISISAEKYNNKLLFTVKDNGLGMTQDVVDKLLSKEFKKSKGSGVGVKNVHERIKLCFGAEYGIEIESELEMGTTVKLWLPIIEDENFEV